MRCTGCSRIVKADSRFCKYCGQKLAPAAYVPPKRKTRSPSGAGSAYKRGNTWTARYRKYTGVVGKNGSLACVERTKGGFRTKAEALAYLPQLALPKKQDRDLTVAFYWNVFEQDDLPRLSHSKQTNYRTAYARMKPYWGMKVADLTVADLKQSVAVCKTFYPAHDMRSLWQRIYKYAAADSPSVRMELPSFISLPPRHETEQEAFTADEIQRVYAAYNAGDTFAGYILLMIYTSMMPGEIRRLEKGMIDLDRHTIVGVGIKTKLRREKPVVFPAWMVPVLQDMIANAPSDLLVAEYSTEWAFRQEFKRTLERIGCRTLTPYACRHTTQTVLGLDPTTSAASRASVMRHSIRMEDRYTHIEEYYAKQAVDQMPRPDEFGHKDILSQSS